jgi:hypothetical protein
MNKNKDKLEFNTPANRQYAYPSIPKMAVRLSIFQFTIVAIFFVPIILVQTMNASLSDVPTGILATIFYLGALCFVDLIHNHFRKTGH